MRSAVDRNAALPGPISWRGDRVVVPLALLVAIQLTLTAGHLVAYGLLPGVDPSAADGLLNFHGEETLPTYWSGTLFTLTAVAALLAFVREPGLGSLPWLAVAIGFGWLALEEVFLGLHERIGSELGTTWTIVYAPVLLLGAWLTWRCVSAMDERRRRLALLGIACLALAVIGEALGRIDPFYESGGVNRANAVRDLIEENLELAGAALLLVAFARERGSRA